MIYSMPPRRRRSWFVGLGATALVVALAACGAEDQPPAVATAGGPGTQPSASAATGVVAQYVEARRQWVACLRERGFQVPDPDARGGVDLRAPGVPKKGDPKWLEAQRACAKYNVPVPEGAEEKPSALTAEEIGHRRAYAGCMRENGIADFPDPGPDGHWPQDDDNGGPAVSEQQAAAQRRAGQICEPVLRGQPSTTPDPHATGRG
ncbi:hypothetical protein Q3W71_27785 [Micromonospora sp. C28SCA-DRY-2]|uniref:hypothetical protein n=1 Tax=Micromonospora sp. C28SCA-DRY-2 TaxID=3059522 RepID=UPI0026774A50|nr:hypothetical protein [Micromonospora sp. C28SCA-DRY-2]MDO3705477.1 hypothetical protein [Micromonospora sp. C28SCA-DRY-2]